ncbi:unnamed protein product [Blepharisma stoltei]|uniref:Uncharacterized protein n=1 Tax=Blepharisma stoltei TaxID=1481888 RepID=A0AAU9IRL6_9CILI|nr:unnamed protein product [Blepharisma stoltei]
MVIKVKKKNSCRKRKHDITAEEMGILEKELNKAWKTYEIPQCHQKLFWKKIGSLSKNEQALKIAKEIDSIEKEEAIIIELLATIERRELLLERLTEEDSKLYESTNEAEKWECTKLIKDIRNVTLDTIENILIWKESFGENSADFVWKNINYLEKIASDTNYLKFSNMSKYFDFQDNDPLFVNLMPENSFSFSTTYSFSQKKKTHRRNSYSVPIAFSLQSRVKAADNFLKSLISPKNIFKTEIEETVEYLRSAKQIEDEEDEIYETLFTEKLNISVTPENYIEIDVKEFSEEYVRRMIEREVDINIGIFIKESCNEIVNASLSLYSNNILNEIITGVLSEITPLVAKEAQVEVINSEYVDIRNLIITEAMEELLLSTCQSKALDLLAYFTEEFMLDSFRIDSYVKQSIKEEINQNQKIVVIVYDEVLNDFLNLDWLEELIEEEVVMMKIDDVRKTLPINIQKEIFIRDKKMIFAKVAELIYFDILNDYIGGVWTYGIVRSVFHKNPAETELSDSEIFPTNTKSLSIRNPRRYQTLINSPYSP